MRSLWSCFCFNEAICNLWAKKERKSHIRWDRSVKPIPRLCFIHGLGENEARAHPPARAENFGYFLLIEGGASAEWRLVYGALLPSSHYSLTNVQEFVWVTPACKCGLNSNACISSWTGACKLHILQMRSFALFGLFVIFFFFFFFFSFIHF